MKLTGSLNYLKLRWKCSDLQVQQQRQETQQDVLQQLVQQMQQLSQSMSLNTSKIQQRQPAPRYFSRHGPCWDCKEFAYYRRKLPNTQVT